MQNFKFQQWSIFAAFLLLLAFASGTFAQNGPTSSDTLSGKYTGTAKREGAADIPFILELKNDNGKVTGHAQAANSTVEISEGSWKDGVLTIKFVGHEGSLVAKPDGDKITGNWIEGPEKRTVEMKRVAAATAPPTAPASTTSGSFSLAGDWDAVADAQGQAFPFVLTFKVDGEKVTGSSNSQLGDSTVTNGLWKDGKLSFQLEGQNGVVVLSATVVDGKLSGEFDYAGQVQGKWVAVKKK